MEIHNIKSLIKTRELAKKDDGFDLESERRQELLIDKLQGIQKESLCFHEPHQIELLNWEHNGDEIIHVFHCNCGKEVTELFKLSKRKVY